MANKKASRHGAKGFGLTRFHPNSALAVMMRRKGPGQTRSLAPSFVADNGASAAPYCRDMATNLGF